MPSQLDICNRALSICGTRSGQSQSIGISSMTENSPEARACLAHFEGACRALLRAAMWSFARKEVSGALLASASGTPENPSGTLPTPLLSGPVVPWAYEYAWPQDCIRLRQIVPPYTNTGAAGTVPIWPGANMASNYPPFDSLGNRVNYQLALDQDTAGNPIRVILSNVEQANVIYTTSAVVSNVNLWDDEFSEAFVFMLAAHLVGALIGDKQMDKELYAKASDMATTARAVDANEQPLSPNHTPDWIRVRGGIGVHPDDGPGPWGILDFRF